jgi:hypothetical protein
MEAILDLQTAFNMAVALGAFLGGWVLNTLWTAIRELQANEKTLSDKVGSIEVLVAGQYVTREDYGRGIARLEATLIRIEAKLDGKQDR